MKNCRSSLIFFFLAQNCLAVTQGILESCRIQVYKPPEQGITSECYLNLVLLNKIVSWLLGSLLLPLWPHLAETTCLSAEINDKVLLHQGKMSWASKLITVWGPSEVPKWGTPTKHGWALLGLSETLNPLMVSVHAQRFWGCLKSLKWVAHLRIITRLVNKKRETSRRQNTAYLFNIGWPRLCQTIKFRGPWTSPNARCKGAFWER